MSSIPSRLPAPVKRLLRRSTLAYLDFRERRRRRPLKVVWLLGHMRSGSTLLMHLLSSHPEILGAGERNATYASAADLRRLAVDAAYARRRPFHRRGYVVDQINHTRFLAAEDLLDHPRLFRIFLVREPEGALASMVEVLGRHYGMTVEEAVDYYLERLAGLARYARRVADRERSLFLTYDDLVARPRRQLDRLETFLGLREPLSERYRTFGFTGKQGDPSARIHSGRVQTASRRRIDVDPAAVERAREAYRRCTTVLAEHCRPGDYDPGEGDPCAIEPDAGDDHSR